MGQAKNVSDVVMYALEDGVCELASIKEIVEDWFDIHDDKDDPDGLLHEDAECGCSRRDGIAPCGQISGSCTLGFVKVYAKGEKCDCGEGCDIHVYATKEDAVSTV